MTDTVTKYSEAWRKFQTSPEFKKQIAMMKQVEPNTREIYFQNRIQRIFDAGWWSANNQK